MAKNIKTELVHIYIYSSCPSNIGDGIMSEIFFHCVSRRRLFFQMCLHSFLANDPTSDLLTFGFHNPFTDTILLSNCMAGGLIEAPPCLIKIPQFGKS